uniref:Uncharacterized protein n=1 Tax=Setaria italica TaxID=4555 RepID=K3ZYZ9_SETIT
MITSCKATVLHSNTIGVHESVGYILAIARSTVEAIGPGRGMEVTTHTNTHAKHS